MIPAYEDYVRKLNIGRPLGIYQKEVLKMTDDMEMRQAVRSVLISQKSPETFIQRFLTTIDFLSMTRLETSVSSELISIVQSVKPSIVENCSSLGQVALDFQRARFMIPVVRPFASVLSFVIDSGVYKFGNVKGYSTGDLAKWTSTADPIPKLGSVALTHFDCVKSIQVCNQFGNVIGFRVSPSVFAGVTFMPTEEVFVEQVDLSWGTLGSVSCVAFRFGVCKGRGYVNIIGEALMTVINWAKTGDRFLFVQDGLTLKWFVHDCTCDDKYFVLSTCAYNYGHGSHGQRFDYQFGPNSFIIGYKSFSSVKLANDASRPVGPSVDSFQHRIKQKLNGNILGHNFSNYLVSSDEMQTFDFAKFFSSVPIDSSSLVYCQMEEIRDLVQVERPKENVQKSFKLFKDAELPQIRHVRSEMDFIFDDLVKLDLHCNITNSVTISSIVPCVSLDQLGDLIPNFKDSPVFNLGNSVCLLPNRCVENKLVDYRLFDPVDFQIINCDAVCFRKLPSSSFLQNYDRRVLVMFRTKWSAFDSDLNYVLKRLFGNNVKFKEYGGVSLFSSYLFYFVLDGT